MGVKKNREICFYEREILFCFFVRTVESVNFLNVVNFLLFSIHIQKSVSYLHLHSLPSVHEEFDGNDLALTCNGLIDTRMKISWVAYQLEHKQGDHNLRARFS